MGVQLDLDFREWRPIKGYEGLYDLRDDGLIYVYPRIGTKGGFTFGTNGGKKGYLQLAAYKNKKRTLKQVHCWVYETFVGPIPKGYDVHHKNHIRTDNRVENLELIEHNEHSFKHKEERLEAAKEVLSKPVLQYTLDNEFIAEYQSISEASRQIGLSNGSINRCLKGKQKTAGGSIWKYK